MAGLPYLTMYVFKRQTTIIVATFCTTKKAANRSAAFYLHHPYNLVVHVGDLPHQSGVHRVVGSGITQKELHDIAARSLILALSLENAFDL